MKKFLHLSLLFALVVGVVACGTRESRPGEAPVEIVSEGDEDRTRNLLGAIGVGILGSMATNAIGMGLGAIPGMPKEIAGLFGGGGDNSAAVLEAIAKIAEQIRELDKKVEEVKQSVQVLDAKVENLAGAVQRLSEQQCASEKFAREAALKDVLILIDDVYDRLYGESGVARGVIDRIKDSKNAQTSATSDERLELSASYGDLKRNPQFDIALLKLSESLLGGPNASAGLIAHMMYCTTQQKRFLTSNDTELWRLYVEYFIVVASKALQLLMFREGYEAFTNNQPLNLDQVNRYALQFDQLARGALFMVTNSIPKGQVLDTRANKMWTTQGNNTTFFNALNTCVYSHSKFANIAPSAGGQLNSGAHERLKDCVTNNKIDSDGEERQWRIPQIYELAGSGANSGYSPVSWAPRGVVGLVDGWNDASICYGGTSRCDTPSRYLSDTGAGALVQPFAGDIGNVWSNTSVAAARGSRNREQNAIMRENDKAMTSRNGHANLTSYHYNGGWLNGGTLRYGFERACREEFNTNPVDAGRFNECRRNFDDDEMGPRCRAIIANDPIPFSMASVQVVNMGPKQSPLRWGSTRITGRTSPTYMQLEPGKVGSFVGSKDFFWQNFTCGTLRKSCGTWTCRKWEEFNFESTLPQVAAVLLVRDLWPNEKYYFTDRVTSSVKSWTERAKSEAPVVRVGYAPSGLVRVTALRAGTSPIEVRCAVNPATSPTRFEEFPVAGPTMCNPASPFRVKPGSHTIYAIVRDRESGFASSVSATSITVEGVAPPVIQNVRITPQSRIATFDLSDKDIILNDDYDYYGKIVAVGQSKPPLRCKIDRSTKSCTIGELVNNTRYSGSVITEYGNLNSESAAVELVPFGAPTQPVASVERRGNGEVELRIEAPDAASIKTPVTSFQVWIGKSQVATCEVITQPTSCVVPNLDNALTYDVVVKAVNAFGATPSLAPTSIRSLTPPGAPSNIAVAGSNGAINVTWDRETDGGPATSYVATAYRPDGSSAKSCTSAGVAVKSTLQTPPANRCDIIDLDGEIVYSVKVVSKNDGGESSAVTAAKTIRPQFVPGVPTAVATVRDARTFVEAVQGAGGSAQRIRVISSPDNQTCEVVLPAKECEIPNLRRDVAYRFRSFAINPSGESAPSELSNPILVYSPPSRPAIAKADNGKSRITVEMRLSLTDAVDGYEVLATPGGAKCTVVLPATSCDLIGLTNGTLYSVTARAFNNGGLSEVSAPFNDIKPIAEPNPPSVPRVTLGREQATITVARNSDTSITKYVIRTTDGNLSCEIVVPNTSCTITELEVGFSYSFIATATNKIGVSLPSQQTPSVVPLEVPLAPNDVILTTNFRDIVVEVLANPDSSPAVKYLVTAMPGNYKCEAAQATAKCVLPNAARGKEYTIAVQAVNSGGVSEEFNRVYYLTAPPSEPDDVEVYVSPTSLVVEVDTSGMNTDSDTVRVTASPGGKSCEVVLPATTCGIDTDTTKVYTLSAKGMSEIGESSVRAVSEKSTAFEAKESTVTIIAPGEEPQVFSISEMTEKQAGSAPTALAPDAALIAIEPTPNQSKLGASKNDPSKKLTEIYASLAQTLLKSVKPAKFSARVPKVAQKVCEIKKSEVVVLKAGECVIAVTYTATIKDPRTKKTMKKKRTATVRFAVQ